MSGRWWRAYSRARHDPKLLKLSDKQFRWWFNLVCVAADNDGILPDHADLAVEFRVSGATLTKALDELIASGLFDHDETGIRPHNWNGLQYKSDVSNERVKRYRERHRNVTDTVTGNVSVTPSESEADTDKNSVAKATGAADVASLIFGNGLDWLKQHSGKSEPDCRSLLGKWRKSLGDDTLIATLGRAQREGALDPVGWIEGAVRAHRATTASAKPKWN